jgi:hypothetical protein
VAPAKVGEGDAVDNRRGRGAELLYKDAAGVRARDGVERVEAQAKARPRDERLERGEVEDLLEAGEVVVDGVDDLNAEARAERGDAVLFIH